MQPRIYRNTKTAQKGHKGENLFSPIGKGTLVFLEKSAIETRP